jgi:DNA mismatch repair protein MutS
MPEINEKLDTSDISLLYPDADTLRRHMMGEENAKLSRITTEQLELDYLMDLKTCDFGSFYTCDPDVILYRQDTFEDMIDNPELSHILLKMIPLLNDITELRRMGSDSAASTEAYLYSITEVELYTSLLDLLRDNLIPLANKFKSTAFRRFAERINTLTGSEYYKNLNNQLKELTSRVREIKSVTIGVNFDSQLRASKAGVLSINNEYFKSGELLDKMLRLDFKNDDMTCIAPLIPFKKGQSDNQQNAFANAFNGAINDVFRQSIRSWKKVIQHYVLENTDFLIRLMPEIEFVTKATELLLKLKERGCPLCHPVIKQMSEKAFDAKGLCNPIVAMKLDAPVVPNDFTFDENGMIYVLTGPNRGGKSVITCAVGIAFVMAQLGLPVCADSCVISPCDEIFTHFPTGSEDTIDKGRLGEECSRLSAIFEEVSEDSLVLCDESLSSTGSYEAAYIASEVLQGFSMVRCRGIFSTHLHDLAASVDAINASCVPNGGVKIDNLVAAIEKGSRSFKILREKPDGKSYARDIAEKYGLSLDKIMTKIKR